MVKAVALLVASSPFFVACGGSAPEPSTAAPPAPESPVGGSSDASTNTPAAPEPTPSTADAGAAAPPPAAPVSSEPSDECTPVSVDFEKRARPKLKECYAAGKKKDPNLEGTVKLKVTVDVRGKIKSTTIVEKTLPDPVAQCMLKVIKTTPFPAVDKCWDATLTIPVTFPTPR